MKRKNQYEPRTHSLLAILYSERTVDGVRHPRDIIQMLWTVTRIHFRIRRWLIIHELCTCGHQTFCDNQTYYGTVYENVLDIFDESLLSECGQTPMTNMVMRKWSVCNTDVWNPWQRHDSWRWRFVSLATYPMQTRRCGCSAETPRQRAWSRRETLPTPF